MGGSCATHPPAPCAAIWAPGPDPGRVRPEHPLDQRHGCGDRVVPRIDQLQEPGSLVHDGGLGHGRGDFDHRRIPEPRRQVRDHLHLSLPLRVCGAGETRGVRGLVQPMPLASSNPPVK